MPQNAFIKLSLPFLVFFALLALLWHELFYTQQGQIPSPLIGETLPSFSLPALFHPDTDFSSSQIKGKVILINVWASWCHACELEGAMLMKIKQDYHIPIYGIAYKDTPENVRAWLSKNGNPYLEVGDDQAGNAAIDLGVYGTPETFIISPSGKIVYRHVGVITQEAWDEVLYPIVRKYS